MTVKQIAESLGVVKEDVAIALSRMYLRCPQLQREKVSSGKFEYIFVTEVLLNTR